MLEKTAALAAAVAAAAAAAAARGQFQDNVDLLRDPASAA
jgi:hypothetical protein